MLSLLLVLIRSKHFTARLSVLLTPTISIDIKFIYIYNIYNTNYILINAIFHDKTFNAKYKYITCFVHSDLFTVLK